METPQKVWKQKLTKQPVALSSYKYIILFNSIEDIVFFEDFFLGPYFKHQVLNPYPPILIMTWRLFFLGYLTYGPFGHQIFFPTFIHRWSFQMLQITIEVFYFAFCQLRISYWVNIPFSIKIISNMVNQYIFYFLLIYYFLF